MMNEKLMTRMSDGSDSRAAGTIALQLENGRVRYLGYIRKRVSDPELAQDILQDCLLRALRSAPTLRDEGRLVQWFYRILQNAITDAYRRRAAETNGRVNYALEPEVTIQPDDEKSICACLNEILPTLKPDYAEVTKLIELDGEEPETVAKRLGISRTNLKVRAHRARKALRKRLEESCGPCADEHCVDCSCR